jgi:transposase
MTDATSDAIEAIKQRRSQIGDFIIISKRDGILEVDLKRGEDHPFANASEIDFFNNATDDIDTLLDALAASEARVAALEAEAERWKHPNTDTHTR